MKQTITMMLLVLATTMAGAQDLTQYKQVIKQLSSAKYQGRGYAKDGANKAGKYLQREFEKAGVDEVTLQSFKLDINTLGEFPVYHVDTLNYDAERMFADLAKPEYANCLVACEFWFTYKHRKDFSKLQKAGECTNAGLIYTWEAPIKFFKAYGEKVVDKPILWVTPEAINGVQRATCPVSSSKMRRATPSSITTPSSTPTRRCVLIATNPSSAWCATLLNSIRNHDTF